jgi:glutathione S-transferase
MTHYKLTYFDTENGRAEPVRLAFHIGGIEFEDHRFPFSEFAEVRKSTPFNAVPVLEIDGVKITQCTAMCRYVGKLAGLYPQDPMQALYCDEAMDATEDMVGRLVTTFGLKGEELKEAREKLVKGWLTTFLEGFERLLERGGGEYLADGRLTVADLKLLTPLRTMTTGHVDHVPKDLCEQVAPGVAKLRDRVLADPRVVAYYAR